MILLAMRIVFWYANRLKQTKVLMKGWNRNVQFHIEGVNPFYARFQDGKASLIKGEWEKPDLIIKGNNKNFRKI